MDVIFMSTVSKSNDGIPLTKTFRGLVYKARGRFEDRTYANRIAKKTRAEGYLVRLVSMKINGKTEIIMYMRA
jgi:hypothetical protein